MQIEKTFEDQTNVKTTELKGALAENERGILEKSVQLKNVQEAIRKINRSIEALDPVAELANEVTALKLMKVQAESKEIALFGALENFKTAHNEATQELSKLKTVMEVLKELDLEALQNIVDEVKIN